MVFQAYRRTATWRLRSGVRAAAGAGHPETPVGYTMAEFGRRVGLSESSVARRIRDGRIRAVKIGRLVRIPASEIGRLFG